MFDTWTPKQREAAIKKGMAGGQLSPYERTKLEEAAKQAGSVGQKAKDALGKSKDWTCSYQMTVIDLNPYMKKLI